MPVDTHEDIQPAAAIEAPNAVETHEDIQPAMGLKSYSELSEEHEPSGYRVDNPGGNWLKGKQESAYRGKTPTAQKGLLGSPTAYAGHDEPLMLPVSELSKLRGVNDEARKKGDFQYDDLAESVAKHGYTNENPVMVFVNHKGQAFINEGNTRVAVARDNGISHIKSWVHWFNGAEDAPGNWTPSSVAKMEKTFRTARAYGGAIPGPKLDQDEPEQFGRRLIEWAFAAAPIVSRSNTPSFAGQWKYPNIHMRKDGGRVEYPLAMTEDAKKAKKGAKIKGMKPEKFLDEARPLKIGKGDRQVIDNFKRDIVSGDPLGPLKLYQDGTEDGRHRATAAEELGVSSVPVIDHRPGKYYGGGMGGGSMGGMGGFKGFSPGFKGSRSRFASSPVPQQPNEINAQEQQQAQQPDPYARAQMTSTGLLKPPVDPAAQQGSIPRLPNYVQGFGGGYPMSSPQQPMPMGQPSNYPTGGFYDVWGPMFGMGLGSFFGGMGGAYGRGFAEGGAVDEDDQRELTPQGFYSAAAEAANNIPQKAPIDQILNKLKGSPNVKNEELDWSGVRDAFAGQKSVDPKEVAQHLQANLPQIKETVYGYDPKTKMKTALKPRYEDYATPGGNNYREVLLHLPEQGEGDYQSSHWGQYGANRPAVKNILAHLRMTDRGSHSFGYPEALHIEEVQSDWGQAGRDIGFDKRKGLNAEERRELNQLVSVPMRERTNDQMNRFNELINQRDFESIPSAPHVTSTEGWTDLALKRALVEAAKGKYKKLTWTPGEEQAERYGLDKSFSQIHYSPDTKHLFAKGKGDVDDIDMNVHEGALSGFIGKELAEKLIASPAVNNTQPSVKGKTVKSLIGGQLAVPQKGMRDFYDRIIPNRLQKLVSKLDPDAKVQLYGHKIDVPGENYPSDANDWKGDEDDWEFRKVHSLEITPKLRAAILKGLPAYDHGGSVIKGALGLVTKLGG